MQQHQDEIVHNITSNQQATHGQVVSNSIGMVILKLVRIYLGDNPTEADFNNIYNECIVTINSYQASDFIKPRDKEDNNQLAEITAITNELPDLVEYIILRMQEPIHPQLDIVTLYLTNKKGTSYQQRIELPLNKVFPLILLANADDSKFTHNYTGTPSERLEQARADRPHRLLSIFKCLKRAKLGLCHTGVRHELVLLLNKIYEDVHLIEDTTAHCSYMLKDKIQERFSTMPDSLPPKELKAALFTWITKQNPTSLLALLDPNHEIESEILTSFVKHGSDPNNLHVKYNGEQIPVQKLIDKLTTQISFSLDRENHAELYMIEFILNANPNHQETLMSQALAKVKAWIYKFYQLNLLSNNIAIGRFYSVYKSHQQLLTHKFLLQITSNLTEDEFLEYAKLFNDYYLNIMANNNNLLPPVQIETISSINQLQKRLKKSRNDNLADRIENFFVLWMDALRNNNINSIRSLYAMVLNEHIARKIILNDNEIIQSMQNHTEKADGQVIKYISPYEINRIFLSAILVRPSNWTELFVTTFKATLFFVKELDRSSIHTQALRTYSYPRELITQLEYLLGVHKNDPSEQLIRPTMILMLPQHAQTPMEWICVSQWLGREQQKSFYLFLRARLEPMLLGFCKNKNADAICLALSGIPSSQQLAFILKLVKSSLRENRNFNFKSNAVLPLYRAKFSDALAEDQEVLALIQTPEQLHMVLELISEEKCAFFLQQLGNEKLQEICKNINQIQLRMLMKLHNAEGVYSPKKSQFVFTQLSIVLGMGFVKQNSTYLGYLRRDRVIAYIESLNNSELINEIRKLQFMRGYAILLKFLPKERYKSFFNHLDSIPGIISLKDILACIPTENYSFFFNTLSNINLKAFFRARGLAYYLNPDNCIVAFETLLDALGSKIKVLIDWVEALNQVLTDARTTAKSYEMLPSLFLSLGDDYILKIVSPKKLLSMLCEFNAPTCCWLLSKLSEKLSSSILQTEGDLNNLKLKLSKNDKKSSESYYLPYMPENIISSEELTNLWQQKRNEPAGLFKRTRSEAAIRCYQEAIICDDLKRRFNILAVYASDSKHQSDEFCQELIGFFGERCLSLEVEDNSTIESSPQSQK
jgi:hypothetical protein